MGAKNLSTPHHDGKRSGSICNGSSCHLTTPVFHCIYYPPVTNMHVGGPAALNCPTSLCVRKRYLCAWSFWDKLWIRGYKRQKTPTSFLVKEKRFYVTNLTILSHKLHNILLSPHTSRVPGSNLSSGYCLWVSVCSPLVCMGFI